MESTCHHTWYILAPQKVLGLSKEIFPGSASTLPSLYCSSLAPTFKLTYINPSWISTKQRAVYQLLNLNIQLGVLNLTQAVYKGIFLQISSIGLSPKGVWVNNIFSILLHLYILILNMHSFCFYKISIILFIKFCILHLLSTWYSEHFSF